MIGLAGLSLMLVVSVAPTAGCFGGLGDGGSTSQPEDCDHDKDGIKSESCGWDDCNDLNATIGACPCGHECWNGQCQDVRCQYQACGEDGCGGSCGSCSGCGMACEYGQCEFVACFGKMCGDDGCGGSCGACGSYASCVGLQCECDDGTCGPDCLPCQEGWGLCSGQVCSCTPNCGDAACGSDGCGDSCGECAVGSVCQGGQCQTLDLSSFTATRIESVDILDSYALSPEDPCWVDENHDGYLDPAFGSWQAFPSFVGVSLGLDLTREIRAGNVTRLLLTPEGGGAAFSALYAWGEPAGGVDEYRIVTSAAYGLPVSPVPFPYSALAADDLTVGSGDLFFFDTAPMREGTYDSEFNAYYLLLSYIPLRDAVFHGTAPLATGEGPVLVEGTLKGTMRKEEVEHAVWLAMAHCAMSGHGSGTCDALPSWFTPDFLSSLFGWGTPSGLVEPGTTPFCAHITGKQVTVTGVAEQ